MNQALKLQEKLVNTAKMVGIKMDESLISMSLVNAAYAANEDDASVDDLGQPPSTVMGAGGKHALPQDPWGLYNVVAFKNPEAKAMFGGTRELWVNQATGESNLLDPEGSAMTVDDIASWCHIEKADDAPQNDASKDAPPVMANN